MTDKSIVLHILELDEERKSMIGYINSYAVDSENRKRYEEIQKELRIIEEMWDVVERIWSSNAVECDLENKKFKSYKEMQQKEISNDNI